MRQPKPVNSRVWKRKQKQAAKLLAKAIICGITFHLLVDILEKSGFVDKVAKILDEETKNGRKEVQT